jgi:hypothetical protein
MLESAVGAVGYVIRKFNQVRENDQSSQSRFETSGLRSSDYRAHQRFKIRVALNSYSRPEKGDKIVFFFGANE